MQTQGPPISARARHLPRDKLKLVWEEFDKLETLGTKADHQKHLCSIFSRLQDFGLVINHSKCIWGWLQSISWATMWTNMVYPLYLKMLFFGMLNFYHRFVPKAAAIMQPLFASTKGKAKMVEWSQDMLTAFSAAKQALAAATLLVHPHETAPTSITNGCL